MRKTRLLSAACLLTLSLGGLSRLPAQTIAFANATGSSAAIQTAAPNRVYVGSVTRTTLSGKTVTGDFLMSLTPDGEATVHVTFNGRVHPFFGQVTVEAATPRMLSVPSKRRSGTLSGLRVLKFATGGNIVITDTAKLSLTVTASAAYGGGTEINGSTFVFTASRLGLALQSSLPITVPVSVGSDVPVSGSLGFGG